MATILKEGRPFCVACDTDSTFYCTRPKSAECPLKPQQSREADKLAMVGLLGVECRVHINGAHEIVITTRTDVPFTINLSRLIRDEIAAAFTRGTGR